LLLAALLLAALLLAALLLAALVFKNLSKANAYPIAKKRTRHRHKPT